MSFLLFQIIRRWILIKKYYEIILVFDMMSSDWIQLKVAFQMNGKYLNVLPKTMQ